MRKYSWIFFNFMLGCLLFSSCVDEELVGEENGKTTKVSFSFEAPDVEQIVTKGVNDYTLIEGLYLFIFDSKGDIEGEGPLYFNINSSANTGTIASDISTTTGDHYIFAIANPTGSAFASVGDLSTITTKKELLSKTATLKGDLLMTGNIIPMVGVAENANADGLINITKQNNSYKIQLKRIIASVKFKVSCGNNKATFDLKSYEVVNAPRQTNYWGDNVSTETMPWSGGTINSSTSEQVFEFYMFENKQKAIGPISDYNDRETKKSPDMLKDIEFANASPNATYVILRGLYTGPATVGGNQENVSVEVSYYVHLGDINKGMDNFETSRNVEYVYKISITGVKELVTEVETDDPYDRGDGTISLIASTFDLDAHYEFFNITVPKGTDYTMEGNSTDLDWVNFRIYDDTKAENLMDALVPGKLAEWDKVMKFLKKGNNAYNRELITTMDQLNNKLTSYFQQNPTAESVKLTCFIEENDKDNFRECLVFRDRKSQNGTTLLRNGFKFRQNYMRKFFNNGGSGYAVEVLNESGKLKKYGDKYADDLSDGWKNMFALNKKFPNKEVMQQVYAACMSRNRDADGDGVIQEDELKWYLPAIDQYIGLWIGADPLKEARLYTFDVSKWMHFMSNSAKSGAGQWILWAEQGSATGGHKDDGGSEYDLRCIRNFGSSKVTKYFNKEADNVITMYLVDEAYRNKQESGELGTKGGHMDTDNKVYRKFKVAKEILGKNKLTWINQRDLANKNNSECSNYVEMGIKEGYTYKTYRYKNNGTREDEGYFKRVPKGTGTWYLWHNDKMYNYDRPKDYSNDYVLVSEKEAHEDGGKWRLPNQRELAVMKSAGYLDGLSNSTYGYIFARTFSTFNSNGAFMFSPVTGNLIQTQTAPTGLSGSVRCVRDI